jgi:hypothetical protein
VFFFPLKKISIKFSHLTLEIHSIPLYICFFSRTFYSSLCCQTYFLIILPFRFNLETDYLLSFRVSHKLKARVVILTHHSILLSFNLKQICRLLFFVTHVSILTWDIIFRILAFWRANYICIYLRNYGNIT